MYDRSDRFDAAIRSGEGTVVSYLDVRSPTGAVALSTDPASPSYAEGLGLTGGEVTVDVTAMVRRTYTAVIADESGAYVPSGALDAFSNVSGNEVRLYRGIRYDDGTVEALPLGVFDIDEPKVDDASLTITLSGSDRMRIVRDNAFVKPYEVQEQTFIVAAVQALISTRRPATSFGGLTPYSVGYRTPYLHWDQQGDPTTALADLLGSSGLIAYFDVDGICQIVAVPAPAVTDPVWSFAEGDTSTIATLAASSTRDDIYNGVIAVGESSFGYAPAYAEAWDTDPNSPTYAGTEADPGPFGRKPKFLTPNPAILNDAQAMAAATGELRKSQRVAGTYDFEFMPHPAFEGYDVTWLERGRLGVAGRYSLERFTIPLDVNARGTATAKVLLP